VRACVRDALRRWHHLALHTHAHAAAHARLPAALTAAACATRHVHVCSL
jgi:hypothetical protein